MVSSINFRGTREDARRVINGVIGALTGRLPDHDGWARNVFYAIGFAALSDIQEDFIKKSRGGMGEDGTIWAPLTAKYLAYQRRFGPGEKAALKKASGLGRAHQHGIGGKNGVLTKKEKERWYQVYNQGIAKFAARYHLQAARAMAAATAWSTVKREGAKTLLEVFGNRVVEILRDTGVLFNSLSPGYLDDAGGVANYRKPAGDGGDQQIFSPLENGVVVGTNVPYARTHNEGDPKRGIPARVFIPKNIPDVWLQRWADVAIKAIESAIRNALLAVGGA